MVYSFHFGYVVNNSSSYRISSNKRPRRFFISKVYGAALISNEISKT